MQMMLGRAQQRRPGPGGHRRLEEIASFHIDIKYTKKKSACKADAWSGE